MSEMQRIALRMEQVSYLRQDSERPVLSKLSLTIPTGQWVAITGKNGSGKSTLIRLMSSLLSASEGMITIDGICLHPESVWDIRNRIGVVFANPDNQFVGQTVAEDIVFGLENRCLDPATMRERLHRYAERLEITSLLQRHPSTLSGGQKQRVAIAAVLAMEPSLIFFDEAGSMLDARSKRDLLDLIKGMHEQGKYTMVSVTHDTDELLAADRMLVLAEGVIAADDRPEVLLKNEMSLRQCSLQTPYVLQLCRSLCRRGISIGELLDEKEVLDALWEFDSIMSLTDTKVGAIRSI
jgi:energy-coupling factor transport system ATP-binding protein